MKIIRTFVAVEINPETRENILRDLAVLKNAAPRVKWVVKDNLHLTLKFLGDVAENDLDEVFAAVDSAAEDHEPFVVEVAGIGAFPHWRSPRVVWAGCGDGSEEAEMLQRDVDLACSELGFDPEKRAFRPHLTLGRVKLPADATGLEQTVGILGRPHYGYIDVDAVTVFMSELRRSGPVYSAMHRASLRAARPD